jgi:hypothetical protein
MTGGPGLSAPASAVGVGRSSEVSWAGREGIWPKTKLLFSFLFYFFSSLIFQVSNSYFNFKSEF